MDETEHKEDFAERLRSSEHKSEQNERSENFGIWGFFIEKRSIAWLILIGIIILGIFSFNALPREIQPEIKIPFVRVTTILPGASPTDTETLITKKLEQEISGVANIKTLSSTSGFGFSSVFVEFEASADLDKSIEDVKDAIDRAKPEFPKDTMEPIVKKAEANTFPVITFSLSNQKKSIYDLTKTAEDIKDELTKIKDVSSVNILGGQKKYIAITVDQQKAENFQLTLEQIANAIKFNNTNIPVGVISSSNLNYSIRIDNRFGNLEQLQNIPILTTMDGNKTPILLKDIAKIEETLPPQNVLSRISYDGETSANSVSLQIYKKDNTNILKVASDAKDKIEELKTNNVISDSTKVIITNDNSLFVEEELGNLTSNGWQTALIIIIILFLAMGLTQGIISGLTIPLTFLMTFPVLDYLDMSFNTLSLFSLVMSLGITIDTTVVIMEGIYEFLKKGYSPREAALLSVKTYKWPLIAGTFTNIFAFFPMLLVSGILGEFLKTMPITITATLLTSLFLSLTLAPSIAVKFIRKKENVKKYHSILEPFFSKLGQAFEKNIHKIIQNRPLRIFTILGSILAFGLSMLLPLTGTLPVEMFPKTDQNYFTIEIKAPEGLIITETEKIAEEIEKYLYKVPEIDNFITRIGTTQSIGLTKDSTFLQQGLEESNLANITINLIPKDERKRKSFEITKEIREDLENFTKAKVSISELQEGPPGESAITLRITGENFDTLKNLADQVKTIIEKTPGTNNTNSSLQNGLNEFEFSFDQDRLAYHGISGIQAAAMIRNIIQGINSTTININEEDLEVIVKYNLDTKENRLNIPINTIQNFEIPSPYGYNIPLSEIAKYDFTEGPNTLEHEEQKRIIKVTSDTEKDVDIAATNKAIAAEIEKMDIPQGYEIRFGGDLEEINESFKELFTSMAVGVILIAFTLVLMFNSFKQPLIMLVTLPLALIGVFPGLYLIGLKLSFPAFLGVVSLGGIVVNNGIVLIDRINENRKNGLEFSLAISEAANARMEPIIMTSLTTILGVIPLSFANAFWAGLGFTIAFGQLVSTVLVLFVIPVLYYSWCKKN